MMLVGFPVNEQGLEGPLQGPEQGPEGPLHDPLQGPEQGPEGSYKVLKVLYKS